MWIIRSVPRLSLCVCHLFFKKIATPDQTCSVLGRSIASNLVILRDMLDYIERTNEPGILISLDQEKAFDRLDRSFLMNLLQHLGFGPCFCKWISKIYLGANMQIMINGWLSEKIKLQHGVRQGESLSPMLYIPCIKLLGAKIRATPEIEGYLLTGARGKCFKVGQYAHDTTGFLRSLYSLRVLLDVISLHEKGSGARLNRLKSEAMWNIYRELLKELSSPPILPQYWSPFLRPTLDMAVHWSLVRDSLTENFKSDLS